MIDLSTLASIAQIGATVYAAAQVSVRLLTELCLWSADRCGKVNSKWAKIVGVASWKAGVALTFLGRLLGSGTPMSFVKKKFVPRAPRS